MIELFRQTRDVEEFQAGQTIFEEGQPGGMMYVVQSGELEVVHAEMVLEIVGPGGVVGEMALIDAQPRSATVVAKTDCMLVPIDSKRFQFLVQQTPFFAAQMMHVMSDRLRRARG